MKLLVQIADDVAHVAVGHGDLQLAHGLQQDGVGLGHGGLIGQLGGGFEGDFGGSPCPTATWATSSVI